MNIVDLADAVAAAADLNDQARGRVDAELEYGDMYYALCICVLETRRPLPLDLITQILTGLDTWYRSETDTQNLMRDALTRQRRQHHAA